VVGGEGSDMGRNEPAACNVKSIMVVLLEIDTSDDAALSYSSPGCW